ncbi:MAG TPA: phasin family protein [Usitatibacteraceae bacterium]
MAKKIVRKATVAKTRAVKSAAAKPARKPVGGKARQVMLAGIGAANRVQDEAVRIYGLIATEAQRLSDMTGAATESLARKAGAYAREGQKIQAQAAATAQARAAETAREVKSFAAKSKKMLKQNVARTVSNTIAGAKEGVMQLEHVFETRVAKTLNTFGIPSGQDVRALQARMTELQKALNQLNKRSARA